MNNKNIMYLALALIVFNRSLQLQKINISA